jgi:hypothetical protein
MKRPVGVTILAILALIGGVLALLGGAALIAVSGSSSVLSSAQITGSTALLLGLLSLVAGVLYLAFGIGSFMAAGWAWVLGIAGGVLSVISDVVSIVVNSSKGNAGLGSNIVSIAISLYILYYLNRSNVKAYYGRA